MLQPTPCVRGTALPTTGTPQDSSVIADHRPSSSPVVHAPDPTPGLRVRRARRGGRGSTSAGRVRSDRGPARRRGDRHRRDGRPSRSWISSRRAPRSGSVARRDRLERIGLALEVSVATGESASVGGDLLVRSDLNPSATRAVARGERDHPLTGAPRAAVGTARHASITIRSGRERRTARARTKTIEPAAVI